MSAKAGKPTFVPIRTLACRSPAVSWDGSLNSSRNLMDIDIEQFSIEEHKEDQHDHHDCCGALEASVVAHHRTSLRGGGEEFSGSCPHLLALAVAGGAGSGDFDVVASAVPYRGDAGGFYRPAVRRPQPCAHHGDAD